jgi:hypothetical protein
MTHVMMDIEQLLIDMDMLIPYTGGWTGKKNHTQHEQYMTKKK